MRGHPLPNKNYVFVSEAFAYKKVKRLYAQPKGAYCSISLLVYAFKILAGF